MMTIQKISWNKKSWMMKWIGSHMDCDEAFDEETSRVTRVQRFS
jgi:hypothetical protein